MGKSPCVSLQSQPHDIVKATGLKTGEFAPIIQTYQSVILTSFQLSNLLLTYPKLIFQGFNVLILSSVVDYPII